MTKKRKSEETSNQTENSRPNEDIAALDEFQKRIELKSGEEIDRLKNIAKISDKELEEKVLEYIMKSICGSIGILISEQAKRAAFEAEQSQWITLLEYHLKSQGKDNLSFLTSCDSFKYLELQKQIEAISSEFRDIAKLVVSAVAGSVLGNTDVQTALSRLPGQVQKVQGPRTKDLDLG